MAGDLHRLTEADAPLLVEATSNEPGRTLWGEHGPYTLDDAIKALRDWDTTYGVIEHGRLLAAVGLMPDGPATAELAYWVRPEERGRGLAVRALTALTTQAHENGFTRVWLEINPTNTPSQRVAERAGYTFEQRVPNHCRDHDCLIWSHKS